MSRFRPASTVIMGDMANPYQSPPASKEAAEETARRRSKPIAGNQLLIKLMILGLVVVSVAISVLLTLGTFAPVFGPFWSWF